MEKNSDHSRPCIISGHIRAFLETLKRQNYSPKSLASYGQALIRFEKFLVSLEMNRVQDVTLDHLNNYRLQLTEQKLTNATIYLYLRTVRMFFNHLEQEQQIFLNPAQKFVIPRYHRNLKHVPSQEDIHKLLAQPDITKPVGVRDRALLETIYSCGLRREEVSRLTIFDPDLKQGTLRVMGKGRKERVLPLGKKALLWLRRYLKHVYPKLCKSPDETSLWISKNTGKRLSYARVDKLIREYAQQAGLGVISTHSLRRACATHMLQNGAHPVQIQLLLGHAGLRHLGQYLRVSITEMKNMHQRSKPGR